MCEINPKHKKIYRLEVFTSHPMAKDNFNSIVTQKLFEVEMELNKSPFFRFHIHELEEDER